MAITTYKAASEGEKASRFDPHRYGFAPSQSARSQWRDLDEFGAIHACPTMAGRAIATNGILVVIERQCDFVVGHYDSWVPYEEPKALKPMREPKERKVSKPKRIEIEFI
jgi:hypothetical protein